MPEVTSVRALLVCSLVLAWAGCGSSSSGSPTDAGATDAGVTDAGITDAGVTDAGAMDAGVTDAGATDAGVTDAGSIDGSVCEPKPVVIPPSEIGTLFAACPTTICATGGHCVPTAQAGGQSGYLAPCDQAGTTVCAPDEFIETLGPSLPPTCASVGGLEGRCLSKCIPMISALGDYLPQDTCSDSEVCAPCYDPRTGMDTTACDLSCDMPHDPPLTFPTCGDGLGECVPTMFIPMSFQSELPVDTCSLANTLCVPTKFVNDPSFVPPTCEAMLAGSGSGDGGVADAGAGADGGAGMDAGAGDAGASVDGGRAPGDLGPGVCLAKYLVVSYAGQTAADLLAQGPCDTGEVCAPCTDPLTGNPVSAPGCP